MSLLLNVNIKEVPIKGLWDNALILLEVGAFGHIILDLWNRNDKFSGAYCVDAVPPRVLPGGYTKHGLAVVIANFGSKPSFFRHADIVGFFHELGHAFHHLMSVASFPSQCGYRVTKDFLEFPAMIFEELAWDSLFLKKLALPQIPDDLLTNLVQSRYLNSGLEGLWQLRYSRFCLEIFKDGSAKNTVEIRLKLEKELNPFVEHYQDSHIELSLRHLVDPLYRSLYYSYFWNEALANDAYSRLTDLESWQEFVAYILSKGGSADPNDMLESFLRRPPNFEHYLGKLQGACGSRRRREFTTREGR